MLIPRSILADSDVNFNAFAPSSLDFFVYTFTKTTSWTHFHKVKQDVLLKILEIIESHGAQSAFPTSTIHVPEGVPIQPTGQVENAEETAAAWTVLGQRDNVSCGNSLKANGSTMTLVLNKPKLDNLASDIWKIRRTAAWEV